MSDIKQMGFALGVGLVLAIASLGIAIATGNSFMDTMTALGVFILVVNIAKERT